MSTRVQNQKIKNRNAGLKNSGRQTERMNNKGLKNYIDICIVSESTPQLANGGRLTSLDV